MMARHLVLLFLALFAVNFSHALPLDELEAGTEFVQQTGDDTGSNDPGEYGDLFEGDIMIAKKRNGHPSTRKRWPNAVVPYTIDSSVDSRGRSVLQQAFNYYHANTCIKLVQRTSQQDYVVFKTPASGCNSYVGRTGGAQTINLAKGCFNAIGTVLHEIMHAIGFQHEMGREDRDQYINILWDNIQDKYKYAFNVHKGSLTYGTKYDITSVMQYGSKAFTKNGEYTITPKDGSSPSKLGQRTELTATDLTKVRAMYSCSGTVTKATTKSPRITTKSPPVTASCTDHHSACQSWAQNGECTKNPRYMLLRCKKACSVCKAAATKCVDQHANCPGWAGRKPSECEANPNYMLYNCMKSCGICGERIGCFNDGSPYDLTGASYSNAAMTPNVCKRYCSQKGYRYAGVRDSNQCFCGNSYGRYSVVSDSNCQLKCKGRSSMTCGGSGKLEIYHVDKL